MSYTDAELEGFVTDEQSLAKSHRATDLPFDMRPAESASLDDLDVEFLRDHYLPSAVDHNVLASNARSFGQQLRSLRLVRGDVPTWGALIAFAQNPLAFVPGASVQFQRLDGNVVTAPILSKHTLSGRLDDVVRRLNELIGLNVATRTIVAGTPAEQRRPDYPVDALRQLAYNAIMHRSYEGTRVPARVYWYSDRVEIASPGGLYGLTAPENFGEGDTDYRNPLLAEIMANLGFGWRFGRGIPLAREALSANRNPMPEFRLEREDVTATVRASEADGTGPE